MKTYSKRLQQLKTLLVKESYSLEESISLIKQTGTDKFVESVEAHFCLNIYTKYSDQQLRTTIILPQGSGKDIKIAVLISATEDAKIVYKSKIDLINPDDLLKEIANGNLNFDLLLTTTEMMPRLTKLGKILGPRGLMPSTKAGTVTTDINNTLKEFQAGKVECRADKTGVAHVLIGKTDFTEEDLLINLTAVFNSVKQNRPSGVKGKYFKSFKVCTTMGPSLNIDLRTSL
jgi:large subunit ribosomal protein L1